MNRSSIRLTGFAVGCIAVGAAGSTIVAASAESPARSSGAAKQAAGAGKGARAADPVLRAARRAVHAELTVATKDGFDEVVVDRGVVTAIRGDALTLRQGTKRRSGETVTVTIPQDARVRVDRKAAKLSDVRAGQRVAVLQLPRRTVVRAVTPKTP
ncbi:hypothetical protein [Paraconexibacter algicola]|uniref:DUF5666 domain-containing protein n=1 Tax=Paraconexibacter algicola TaxID=2133960 RepID=A0A2T4UKF3_9ACTN|nr:hypothetical protein [Paraconexibacter algicola]PTL59734.1 hypothetical protein C7Y72_08745 [Paraconexibacter algicola]